MRTLSRTFDIVASYVSKSKYSNRTISIRMKAVKEDKLGRSIDEAKDINNIKPIQSRQPETTSATVTSMQNKANEYKFQHRLEESAVLWPRVTQKK